MHSPDTWEARMAARTRQREADKAAATQAAVDLLIAERLEQRSVAIADRSWLNGWPSLDDGRHVLMEQHT